MESLNTFIALLLLGPALTSGLRLQSSGWLDRVVQYQKEKFFKELEEMAPFKINAEIHPKPVGYVDSAHWDYDSVIRLLNLIRQSETAKPVYKALRRMLQPTRRIMMSMKESMQKFPSLMQDTNFFYYDVEYTSEEEDTIPAPPPLPEDQVVVVVSNPVEARLPSARISVQLLREILEARARAARQMPPTTPYTIPWKPMTGTIATITTTPGAGATDAGGDAAGGSDASVTGDSPGDGSNASPTDEVTPAPGQNPNEQQGPEQQGPEQQGPEQQGPEQQGPEQQGPEQQGPEQ